MHWMEVTLDLALIQFILVSQLCLSFIHDARLWLNITKPSFLWAAHHFSPSSSPRVPDGRKALGGFYQVQLNQEVSSVGVSHTHKTKRFLSCEEISQLVLHSFWRRFLS